MDGLLWVDLAAEANLEHETMLLDTFKFHPLAIDDALRETHVPKVDDWGTYLYIVLRAVDPEHLADEQLGTLEVDIFLGQNYLVTYHPKAIAAVDRVWASCYRDERHVKKGASHLLYKLVDELVADYMPVVERIDEAIDEIEQEVFAEAKPIVLERIFVLKRNLLHFRRVIAPQREVLNKLARGDYAVIDAEAQLFFRDVYDHLVRLHDLTESLRDLVGSALDTYLSVVNNRMNDVMRTLTVITTLFMPISFLVGFFGMNFFQPVAPMDMWTGQPTFVLMLVIMVLMPVGMYLWIWQRAWM
jgi:magnesium transporter